MRAAIALLLALASPVVAAAQQVADPGFAPAIGAPAFAAGRGPVVLVDEAHFNFHTAGGRYRPFADLLRRDGFVVSGSPDALSAASLARARILVISNALGERNQSNWDPPVAQAFSPAEVAAVRRWIEAGGALLLIADHAPFASAAADLGTALGVRFSDGWVRLETAPGPMVFSKQEGTLKAHAVTEGVDAVATFTGSSFELLAPGEPLLVFGPGARSYANPQATDSVPVAGRLQGAVMTIGKGRVAIFGEAAMFSAQLAGAGKRPMGMNAPIARQNPQFLLNVMRWLAHGAK
jgi:hypothetical protein